jgi:hypothetical protein
MAVYADFDERFRPRPALWRVAVVSFSQFAVALLITHTLIALAEMGLLAHLARPTRWVFHATAWSTLPRQSDPEVRLTAAVAFGLVLLGALVLTLWPTRNTLARRLFVSVFAMAVSVFGATAFALRHDPMLGLAVALAALWLCARAELRAIGVVASVVRLDRLATRLQYWLVRIVPSMVGLAFIDIACVPIGRSLWLAGGLAAITLLMNLTKHATRFEVIEEPELRRAAMVLPAVAAAVLALSTWMWPRKVVVTRNGIAVERFVRSPAARW